MEAAAPKTLVFDIETIADLTAENREAVAALAKGRGMSPEQYGALCPPLARVVCIAWFDVAAETLAAVCDATLCSGVPPPSIAVEDGGGGANRPAAAVYGCGGEAEVLGRFGRKIEEHFQQPNAQLVTFNGRGFDLPVLLHRTAKHGVRDGRALLLQAMRESRHQALLHVDLLELATFNGASGRWPLAAYAIGYGLRSPKTEMDGAAVGAAVEAGRLIDVVRYCFGDVRAAAHVYQRLQGR
jgi:DNA polymerase elongation subunit (family B)